MWKPMLAGRIEDQHWKRLRFPLNASAKLDGIRAMVQDGVLVSRNLKPIRNEHVQSLFGDRRLEGVDGELIVGEPNDPLVFNKTSSGVMSQDGKPDVRFFVFDRWGNIPYNERRKHLVSQLVPIGAYRSGLIHIVEQKIVTNYEQIRAVEETYLNDGYEGVMLRTIDGAYKQGRSSVLEGHLMKLKRFLDSEAEIVEVEEQYHNANEAVRELNGRLKRSSHQAGMVPKGTAGSLRVKDLKTGVVFNIGSGLDDAIRNWMWANRAKLVGSVVKYKHFPIGQLDRPRFPIFLGMRDKADM